MRGRLLFLCQNLPEPPDAGARIRSYHTVRLLSREFEVTALCFVRGTRPIPPQTGPSTTIRLSDFCEVETFPIPQAHSRLRLFSDHARSVVTWRAYTRWAYESAAFRHRLRSLVRSTVWNLVYVDSIDLAAYLDVLPNVPVVLGHHNVESQLLMRRAKMASGWRGWYMKVQSALTQSEERNWCGRVDLNVVVSPQDQATLEKMAPGGRYVVVPNGVDTSAFSPDSGGKEEGVVFVGGASWSPNLDGMEYFAEQILPFIRHQRPDTPVTWVGQASDQVRRQMRRFAVETTGHVDDIRPFVRRAACVIVPLRVGGGTRLKILDAWALGKAVVSTSQGCEGLEAVDGQNLLVRDSPAGFARAVLQLIEDHELRRRIGNAARVTAVARYDWETVGQRLTDAVRRLSKAGPREGGEPSRY